MRPFQPGQMIRHRRWHPQKMWQGGLGAMGRQCRRVEQDLHVSPYVGPALPPQDSVTERRGARLPRLAADLFRRPDGGLGAVFGADFAETGAQVHFDRGLADAQLIGDGLVGGPVDQLGQDQPFTPREPMRRCRSGQVAQAPALCRSADRRPAQSRLAHRTL